MSTELEFSLRNELSELSVLTDQVEAFAASAGLSEAEKFNLNLVLDELVTNTIQYGYPEPGEHRIEIRLQTTDEGIEGWVSDDGAPFDPLQRDDPDLETGLDERAVGGLGIHLVRRMVDHLEYHRLDGSNRLRFRKRTSGA